MLRDMTLADVDAVLAVEQAVQHFPWTWANFSDALGAGYLCHVDESQGVLRGYTILMLLVDEAELLNITVAANHRRKGLGRAMLNEILEMARNRKMKRVFLEVRQSNLEAITLYGSVGFHEIGRRHGYYQNNKGNEDALVMAYQLTGQSNG